MRLMTVEQYAKEYNLLKGTVYKHIERGKLKSTEEVVNGRKTKMVIAEIETPRKSTNFRQDSTPELDSVQEGEIVENETSYALISMDKDSYDNTINTIKEMSYNNAVKSEQLYNDLKEDYYKVKAELDSVKSNLTDEKIKSATNEIEVRILNRRIDEMTESHQRELNELKQKLEKEKVQLEEEIGKNLKRVEDFENQLKELNHTLSEKNYQLNESQKSIQEKEHQLQELNNKVNTLQEVCQSKDDKINDLNKTLEELQRSLNKALEDHTNSSNKYETTDKELKESQKTLLELQTELKTIKEDHQKEIDVLEKQIEELKKKTKWFKRDLF